MSKDEDTSELEYLKHLAEKHNFNLVPKDQDDKYVNETILFFIPQDELLGPLKTIIHRLEDWETEALEDGYTKMLIVDRGSVWQVIGDKRVEVESGDEGLM